MNTKKKFEEKLNYNQKRVIVSIGDFINGGMCMETIGVVYYPCDQNSSKILSNMLKQKDALKTYHLEEKNLWLPFDFHLYEDALVLRPNQESLTKEDIEEIARNEFSWYTSYFAMNPYSNLEKIIANRGYVFEQLKKMFPEFTEQEIVRLEKNDFSWIEEDKKEFVKSKYQQVIEEWNTLMLEDFIKKVGSDMPILIVSFDSEKALIDLEQYLVKTIEHHGRLETHHRTCYFLESDYFPQKTGIERIMELSEYKQKKEMEKRRGLYK